jgi:serine protease AprX
MTLFSVNYPVRRGYSILTTPARVNAPTDVTGRGVVVAFIDSGFYPHPDLAGRVLRHVDATSHQVVESNRHFHEPAWYSWHGQMTSVIATGAGKVFPGIAPDARLVLIKVSNRKKQIKEADILRGFEWLITNHRRFKIRVVNVSVGGDFVSEDAGHPLHRAVQRLHDEGVVVCVAAGNQGSAHLVPPASAPAAITVGGFDDQNSLNPADWEVYPSNWGTTYDGRQKPELIAPARWIASPILPGTREARMAHWLYPMIGADELTVRRLIRRGYADLGIPYRRASFPGEEEFAKLQGLINRHKIIDAEHQHVDGTSVSVAIVSGVVAQLIELQPTISPATIRAILTESALLLPGIPRERQGGGILNPVAALSAVRAVGSQ